MQEGRRTKKMDDERRITNKKLKKKRKRKEKLEEETQEKRKKKENNAFGIKVVILPVMIQIWVNFYLGPSIQLLPWEKTNKLYSN